MFEFTLHTIISLFIIYYTNNFEPTSKRYELDQVFISSKYQLDNDLPQMHDKFKRDHNSNPLSCDYYFHFMMMEKCGRHDMSSNVIVTHQ